MIKELEQFYKRFNIKEENTENAKKFKNSLNKILEKQIGNLSLTNEFRDVFIKYTGIEHKDFGTVNCNTEIDFGQREAFAFSGTNYIKFYNTCIGKAFQEDLSSVIKYLQILFLMDDHIIPNNIKENLHKEISEIIDVFGININIIKENNKYLIYPKGAKELDAAVNDVLLWLEKYEKSRKKLISALNKYQQRAEIRNILDDLRLSLELFMQEVFNNKKTLENNKSEIGKILKENNINKEIINMYITIFDYYTKYQNNNVKHDENCYDQEIEFILYLTCIFIRTIIKINN